jgi:hypothetical protein
MARTTRCCSIADTKMVSPRQAIIIKSIIAIASGFELVERTLRHNDRCHYLCLQMGGHNINRLDCPYFDSN